ncbi:hypothetical protein DSL72_002756 [Monilinia vaccinii-corymbosi]|uniref:Uncharacterized protein n=1 Tax=Monilinia vaccinii-corymbosi TaxID=61207 RepID=A0A8A3PDK4_9HELO|nr:hypothetical protein DSL72_002756 [Monilinia vaccinii-corymbosi]
MYTPLPQSTGPSAGDIISDVRNKYMKIMTAAFAQTVQQFSSTSVYKRAEELASDKASRGRDELWLLLALCPVLLFGGLILYSRQRDRDNRGTRDTRNLNPWASNRPRSGRPTGEMGAARAALGATIEPQTGEAQSHRRNTQLPLDGKLVVTKPGAVATRLEQAGIESTPVNRPLRLRESYLSTENGTRVISRPISEPDSVYSLRRGESTAQMRRRVDNELHEAFSAYPIFQNSLQERPAPREPLPAPTIRPTTPISDVNVHEEVRRPVPSFPVYEMESETLEEMIAMARQRNPRPVPPSPVYEMESETLEQMIARARRMNRLQGLATPPPAYEHAPSYEEEYTMSDDEGSTYPNPPDSPPAYVR